MDSDSYIVYKKTEDIYTDIVNDFETRFNASNYKLDRLLPPTPPKKKKIGK